MTQCVVLLQCFYFLLSLLFVPGLFLQQSLHYYIHKNADSYTHCCVLVTVFVKVMLNTLASHCFLSVSEGKFDIF